MYFTCLFRNCPRSTKIERYAESKLKELVTQFTHKPFRIHLTIEAEGVVQLVQIRLVTDKVFSTSLTATGSGAFEAIDNVAGKLRECLRRRKERLKATNTGPDKFRLASLGHEIVSKQWMSGTRDEVDAQEILAYEAERKMYGNRIHVG